METPQTLLVPIGSLNAAKYNPRVISEEELSKLKRSIAEFGLVQPFVGRKEDGLLIGGHQRLTAFRALLTDRGLTDSEIALFNVPAVLLENVSDARAMALNLALNKISGEWDYAKLGEVFETLRSTDVGVEITGFDADAVDMILSQMPSVDFSVPKEKTEHPAIVESDDEDATQTTDDSLREKWQTELGQLWQVGKHRVLCGDATIPSNVRRLCEGRAVDIVWTDPPYGVSVIAGDRNARLAEREARGHEKLQNDSMSTQDLRLFLDTAFANFLEACKPGAIWYVAAPSGPMFAPFIGSLNAYDVCHAFIVWVKDAFVFGRSDYHYRHELVVYGWKPGAPHYFHEDRKQDTVWEIKGSSRKFMGHPSVKPVELVARALRNSSLDGELVLDPFLGSGTTLVAAEQEGRTCYGMELEPKYCALALERASQIGLVPELQSSMIPPVAVLGDERETVVAGPRKRVAKKK